MASSHEDKVGEIPGWVEREFIGKLRAGGMPSVTEIADRVPHLREEVISYLNHLLFVEQIRSLQTSVRPEHLPLTPRSIRGYEIRSVIGLGGMGVVYHARQLKLNRSVAIKVLHVERQDLFWRFRQEAETISRLDHPNIVRLFDFDEVDGVVFLVMQYIPGLGLDKVLGRLPGYSSQVNSTDTTTTQSPPPEAATASPNHGGDTDTVGSLEDTQPTPPGPLVPGPAFVPSDFNRIALLGADVASALKHSHEAGIIHRDIKPGNLILDSNGKIWVGDFGLAKVEGRDGDLSHTGDVIGTPRYMAPEQARGHADVRSDIYSFGITLWEMATGHRVWDSVDGELAIHTVYELGSPPSARSVNSEVPAGLSEIIARCCEWDPNNRFQSFHEVQERLLECASQIDVELSQASFANRVSSWVLMALGVLAVSVAVVVFSFLTGRLAGLLMTHPEPAAESVPRAVAVSFDLFDIPENQTSVFRLTELFGMDPKSTRWNLGGDDAARFRIDEDTSVLEFRVAPDFETPSDVSGDSRYSLTITALASDESSTPTVAKGFTIRVRDIDEPISVGNGENRETKELFIRDGQMTYNLAALQPENLEGGGFTAEVVGGADQDRFRVDMDTLLRIQDSDIPSGDSGTELQVDVLLKENKRWTWAGIAHREPGVATTLSLSDGLNLKQFKCLDIDGFDLSRSVGLGSHNGVEFFTTLSEVEGTTSLWRFQLDSEFRISSFRCLCRDLGLKGKVTDIDTADGRSFVIVCSRSAGQQPDFPSWWLATSSIDNAGRHTIDSEYPLDVKAHVIESLAIGENGIIRMGGWLGSASSCWATRLTAEGPEKLNRFAFRWYPFAGLADWPLPASEQHSRLLKLRFKRLDWMEYGICGISRTCGAEMHVMVENQSEEVLTVFWLNYDGVPVELYSIMPSAEHKVETYVGHECQIRSADGTLWESFGALERMPKIVIKQPREVTRRPAWQRFEYPQTEL